MFILLTEKPECFVIEQPADTPLTLYYELPALEKIGASEEIMPKTTLSKAVEVTLLDRRNGKPLFSKTIADHKGEVSLTTKTSAAHHLCLKPVHKQPTPIRLDLSIDLGLGDRYYDELANTNKMDELQLQVVKLNDELAQILNEADYMKEKEVKFHRKAERMNLAAIWWPILQLCILVVTGVFQVKNLKRFFATKNFY